MWDVRVVHKNVQCVERRVSRNWARAQLHGGGYFGIIASVRKCAACGALVCVT